MPRYFHHAFNPDAPLRDDPFYVIPVVGSWGTKLSSQGYLEPIQVHGQF